MKNLAFACFGVLLVSTSVQGSELGASICMDLNQTTAIVDCLNRTFDTEDALLNQAYQRAVSHLRDQAPERLQNIKSAELAWIRFRDSQCKYDYTSGDGGDDSGIAEMVCRVTQTTKRRVDLEQEFVRLRKGRAF